MELVFKNSVAENRGRSKCAIAGHVFKRLIYPGASDRYPIVKGGLSRVL